VSTWDRLRALPVTVDTVRLEPLQQAVSPSWVRETTVVVLAGDGCEGRGEDVTYETPDVHRFQRAGLGIDLRGRHTLDELSQRLDDADLFTEAPEDFGARAHRRWAVEAAALDLALRQAGEPLWRVVDRAVEPVRFVASPGLGSPPSLRRVDELAERCPSLRFKLDARSSWDDALIAALMERDGGAAQCVACIDLKGQYPPDWSIYQPADEVLYERVFAAFPHAWFEDPALADDTRALVETAWDRVAWDAPIVSPDAVSALPHLPAAVNLKPARLGSLRALCDAYDLCARHGIATYGGGDFELGAGRRQNQYLAALFHADAPNDLAPSLFNRDPLPSGTLPQSPLRVSPSATGFDLETAR
jgi:L-alanine-DL-glutamate epimerase-like enolase superfamily enzyme